MAHISSPDFVVAMAGLDLLPATRLRMACSLLAADHMTVHLVEWGTQKTNLLVADETSKAGRDAIQSARQGDIPSIRLNGTPRAADNAPVLPRLATVREFVDALKCSLQNAPTMLLDAPSAWDAPLPQPMLEYLRLDRRRDTRVLLESGLFRIVSDTRSGQIHMLRRMPLEELLERSLKLDWRVTQLPEKVWQSAFLPDVTRTYAIETLWWRLPPHLAGDDLPRVTGASRLRTWPDLDPAATPSSWPLLLAHLAYQRWCAEDLATATELPMDAVLRVMALVRLSGLEAVASDPAAVERTTNTHRAGTLVRMAKRFGLKLLGRGYG